MPAGRPRKYENDAAKQAAYRERHAPPRANWTPSEARHAIAQLHTWAKLAATSRGGPASELASDALGSDPRETLTRLTELFRKAYHDEPADAGNIANL